MKHEIISIDNSIFSVNSYLIINENNNALIVDPSFDEKVILKQIELKKCKIVGILITHIHQDHIYSIDFFAKKYRVPVMMSSESAKVLNDPILNLSFIGKEHYNLNITKIDSIVTPCFEDNIYKIAEFEFSINVFPGHSPGCTIFNFKDFLLTGDFVLNMSIGRFDWPGSSVELMRNSLSRFKKIHMNTDLPMYSGHGIATNVQSELRLNPYLNGTIKI